ncbi:MAG: esterase [Mycobacterium sp.]
MRTLLATAALTGVALISPATAGAAPLCTDFGGTVSADQMCQVHVSNPQYLLDMVFPVNYPDTPRLSAYLNQTRDGFVNVADMPGNRNLPYALDVKSTRHSTGSTQSVVLEVYQNVGGAHPSTWYKTFNYDTATRAPITFDNLFPTGSKPIEAIYPIVMKDLTQQLGQASISPLSDGLDPTHYQNFVITDDALIFYFGQGELLPEAAGALQSRVPRSAVPPLQL